MKDKIAILQVADSGPLESLVLMLHSAGFLCKIPSTELKQELRRIGCDTVLNIADLAKNDGYEEPFPLPVAELSDMKKDVLFVDIKAQRNMQYITERWPNLEGKILWYRINGGKPEHVIRADGFDCGDEVDPGCPILTPNLWYRDRQDAYACWPPFHRFEEYISERPFRYAQPMCLIHNVAGWGYQSLVEIVRELGVACYGRRSPDGLINHQEIPTRLTNAQAMVHLKSSDAPGYALYEALAAACPVVCTRRLIWRNRMQELFIPGETCYVFDRETEDALTPKDLLECRDEIKAALTALSKHQENERIGENGRKKLKSLMWNEDRDGESFRDFMSRSFPWSKR